MPPILEGHSTGTVEKAIVQKAEAEAAALTLISSSNMTQCIHRHCTVALMVLLVGTNLEVLEIHLFVTDSKGLATIFYYLLGHFLGIRTDANETNYE